MNDEHDVGATEPEIARIEALLRELSESDADMTAPPADVWEGIEAAVASRDGEAEVVVLDRRRRFSSRVVALGAAAAVAALIVGSIAIVAQRGDDGSTVVASAELTYDAERFDALGATATARVSLVDDGGTFHVEFDESVLPSPTDDAADLEVWLIEPDADGNPADLVSIGLIDPENPGDFEIPAGYDPDVFFVVDVSVEPRDGDAAHSGRSILRGPLIEA